MASSSNIGFDLSNFARNKQLAEQYNGGKDLLNGELFESSEKERLTNMISRLSHFNGYHDCRLEIWWR